MSKTDISIHYYLSLNNLLNLELHWKLKTHFNNTSDTCALCTASQHTTINGLMHTREEEKTTTTWMQRFYDSWFQFVYKHREKKRKLFVYCFTHYSMKYPWYMYILASRVKSHAGKHYYIFKHICVFYSFSLAVLLVEN